MKAFLDYLCELSASDSPKYSVIYVENYLVSKRIIGKRVGKQNTDFTDTIMVSDFFCKCNEWRSYFKITSGDKIYYVSWYLQIKSEQLYWRFL